MKHQGYYRFPDVRGDRIVFVSEDDLWLAPLAGGKAHRLTVSPGNVSYPIVSPDGKWIVFTATDEGYGEMYLIPADGGKTSRLTYLGSAAIPLGWSDDSKNILFTSGFAQAYGSMIYTIPREGGEPEVVPVGHANKISYGPQKGVVIGRHTRDTARWKRYRGGTAGELWIDREGNGTFEKLIDKPSNYDCPMWIGNRIYFISDHEGIGNIYSCDPKGKAVKRHTGHSEYYVRNARTDGKTIVYHAGADLWALDLKTGKNRMIELDYNSPVPQTVRKNIENEKYLQGYDLSKRGTHTVAAIRGKLALFANWNGPVRQAGRKDGVRYRIPRWLHDGKRFIAVSDEVSGEDQLLLVDSVTGNEDILPKQNLGRIHTMEASPVDDRVMLTNHRNELILIDLAGKSAKTLDTSDHHRIDDINWSPDGRWVTYTYFNTRETMLIRVVQTATGEIHDITAPVLNDHSPVFSACGKYIFFAGVRVFEPVYDAVHFDLGFLKATQLYAVPLKKDIRSPFDPDPKSPLGEEPEMPPADKKPGEEKPVDVEIEFDGIEQRIVPFPIDAGMYFGLTAIDKKVMWLEYPRDGLKHERVRVGEPKPRLILHVYDFEKQTSDVLIKGISWYRLSADRKTMMIRKRGNLTVLKAGEKPKEKVKNKYSVEGGEIDMKRIKLMFNPREEWRQMYREAWLLQREHFWTPDMSGVDWDRVYKRYLPLLERLGSRAEFSDLIWEMQGELGTSHCYEFGGDYRSHPVFPIGKLGCSFKLAANGKYYVIGDIFQGDPSSEEERSPLTAPGVNIEPGDHLLAVNGIEVNDEVSPREALMNLGGQVVTLTIVTKGKRKPHDVVVKTLHSEMSLLYREWVEKNKRYVHEQSGGKIGYIHIPDMGTRGYSEFHRHFMVETQYDALIVDVRYNGGGHVSQLLLEKINRKRLGYDKTRWSKEPEPYPSYSMAGPIVAITNQFAGSDGDIFSHSFKMMKIGELIGKRTWGGVIGINGQYSLADGAVTTQPEYSFWFKDVGWGVENYGTDPDIEVDILPGDYVKNKDPQLDKAIDLIKEKLEKNPVEVPPLDNHPDLSLPEIPE